MWIFLTHRLTHYSREQKKLFLKRLNDHAESSRSLNYFTATIQDYGITLKSKQGRVLIRDRFGKRNFYLILAVSETADGCIVHVTVKPTLGNIIIMSMLALFVLVCQFPLALKVAFVGALFILELVALAFNVWWTNDLFEKKLLNANSFSQRS